MLVRFSTKWNTQFMIYEIQLEAYINTIPLHFSFIQERIDISNRASHEHCIQNTLLKYLAVTNMKNNHYDICSFLELTTDWTYTSNILSWITRYKF